MMRSLQVGNTLKEISKKLEIIEYKFGRIETAVYQQNELLVNFILQFKKNDEEKEQ